jgi:hypothetical protein
MKLQRSRHPKNDRNTFVSNIQMKYGMYTDMKSSLIVMVAVAAFANLIMVYNDINDFVPNK